jgi:NCS1 family nucleobase:cation symporter-1
VLIADYFLVKRRQIDVDEMYTLSPTGRYFFRGGYNPVAIAATVVGAVLAMLLVLLGSSDVAAFSWFLGAGAAFLVHWAMSRRTGSGPAPG